MDIFELSLLYFTDFKKFEDLATELMKKEGHYSIHQIGGIGDDGVDAEEVHHYQDETTKCVFQYSLQANVSSKITSTIKKLKDKNVEFDEMVIVTNQLVNNKQDLRRKAREKSAVKLQIFDMSDLKAHLGNDTLLFNRYFPNIDEQLDALRHQDNIFTENSEDLLEKSMLKCSLIFSFIGKGKEKHQKDHLFYQTILSIIANSEKGMSAKELADYFLSKYKRIVSPKEINEAISYLINEDWVHKDSDKFKATNKISRKVSLGIADIKKRTEAMIRWLIDSVSSHCEPEKMSKEKEDIITANVKHVLNTYFRLYGAECCGEFDAKVEDMMQSDIVKIATKNLSKMMSEWVLFFLGQLFSKPTDEQRETLSLWAKCFMGMELMKLDPMLSEFQLEKLRGKTFVLDTDFVLYSITDACKESEAYKQIIKVLVSSGCNVVIPDEIVHEVANHAASAVTSYHYFKSAFGTINEDIVEEEINNIFVKDYFLKSIHKEIHDMTFQSYLYNYYDENDRDHFMAEVTENRLKGVTIGGDFSTKGVIPDDDKFKFIESINEELKKTPKAQRRSDKDNYALSQVDADLYLYVLEKNQDIKTDKEGKLLWGSYYLLTNSTRTARCAKKHNIYKNVITNPTLIYNLIDEIGFFSSEEKNGVFDLFANPFLAHVVSENWNFMKAFADRGVDLRGREVPRLKRELNGVLHSELTTTDDISEQQDVINDGDMPEFIALAREIKSRGYSMVPSVQKQIDAFQEKQDEINELGAQLNAVNNEIAKKNKRQQRHFDNIKKHAVKTVKRLKRK